MISVFLPSQLDQYTDGLRKVQLSLAADQPPCLQDVITALDQQFPGVAFRLIDEQQRIRRHIAIFVGENLVRDLAAPLDGNDRIQIVGALSGG